MNGSPQKSPPEYFNRDVEDSWHGAVKTVNKVTKFFFVSFIAQRIKANGEDQNQAKEHHRKSQRYLIDEFECKHNSKLVETYITEVCSISLKQNLQCRTRNETVATEENAYLIVEQQPKYKPEQQDYQNCLRDAEDKERVCVPEETVIYFIHFHVFWVGEGSIIGEGEMLGLQFDLVEIIEQSPFDFLYLVGGMENFLHDS